MVIRIYTVISTEKHRHSLQAEDLVMQSCSVGNARTIPGIRVIDAGFNNEPGLLFLLLV